MPLRYDGFAGLLRELSTETFITVSGISLTPDFSVGNLKHSSNISLDCSFTSLYLFHAVFLHLSSSNLMNFIFVIRVALVFCQVKFDHQLWLTQQSIESLQGGGGGSTRNSCRIPPPPPLPFMAPYDSLFWTSITNPCGIS